MTNIEIQLCEFINNINKEYKRAREPIYGSKKSNIFRGRSRCISAIAEDLFALLISNCVGSDLYYFVDQPIKCKIDNQNKIYCPDLLVCQKESDNKYLILYMLDLKMDIGWIRNNIDDKLKKLTDVSCNIKNADTLSGRDGKNKDKILLFESSSDICYDIVVVSAENAGSKKKVTELCDKSSGNENIWILSNGAHPNGYGKVQDFEYKYADFNKLIEKIKGCVQR